MNFSDSKYNQGREWIKNARNRGVAWSDIYNGNNPNGLDLFLKNHRENDFWDINEEEWIALCERQKENEEESSVFDVGPYIIPAKDEEDYFKIPTSPSNMWVAYKDKLLKSGFKEDSVDIIENTTHRILNRLKISTLPGQPIKGLVIGNVQSGKTANMAALMSMAADVGWNFFVVLSGTIENLRIQTQKRLEKDLYSETANIKWQSLDNVKIGGEGSQTDQLYLNDGSNIRYFTVCLKNSTRLKNLIKWLNRDKNKKKQMKILLIDDEADQAGINSASIEKREKTAINRAVTNLIYDLSLEGEKQNIHYKCMNYIGYTATPYANVLNENPGDESNPYTMFPDDFVAVLKSPNEYFGPQQIFGSEGLEPLNIINHISKKEIMQIRSIERGESETLPEEMLNSIYWFYCCVACFRLWNFKKPISLLIHTSQRIASHEIISNIIENYLSKVNKNKFISSCEEIWEEQTSKLDINSFFKSFKNYGGENIKEYPAFNELKSIIGSLISSPMQKIKMDEDKTLTYTKGVHLCVDNGQNNVGAKDKYFLRLAYPDKDSGVDFATAFIVVGGATLSRGLTIEGLVSTYFLRTVKQADTLMQMGRWFGYRKQYELLPRVWMSYDTEDKFKFLSELDLQLKKSMANLDSANLKPRYYGIKVKNTPKPSWMILTSKKKMQRAIAVDLNYTGAKNQTTTFYDDEEKLNNNLNKTNEFIKLLDSESCVEVGDEKLIWRNINHNLVFEYMKKLELPPCSTFIDIETMEEWFNKVVADGKLATWNIVLSGKNNLNNIQNLNGHIIGTVNRARRKDDNDGIIRIGALRNPADLYADIEKSKMTDELLEKLKNSNTEVISKIRDELGLSMISELIIYIIDKESKAENDSKTMKDLNVSVNVVGIAINIPGGKIGNNYSEALMVSPINEPDEEGDYE